jgi:hypothetical protein
VHLGLKGLEIGLFGEESLVELVDVALVPDCGHQNRIEEGRLRLREHDRRSVRRPPQHGATIGRSPAYQGGGVGRYSRRHVRRPQAHPHGIGLQRGGDCLRSAQVWGRTLSG